MMKLQRARNNVSFGQFFLKSNELQIETFYRGKLDMTHLFHLNGEMINIIITNNNGISAVLSSSDVNTVAPSNNIKWTIIKGDVKFYRDGTQVFTDIIPFDVDLTLTFDKSNLEDTFINHSIGSHTDVNIIDPVDGQVMTYNGSLGKFVNAAISSSSNMPYKFIEGFLIDDPPSPDNGDWFIDYTSHNLLFSVMDTNDNDHSDIFSKIGFNTIIRVNMTNGNHRYYCVTQATDNDNYYIFKYDNGLSSIVEGTLVEDTVYDVSFYYQTVRNIDDLGDVYIDSVAENQVLQYASVTIGGEPTLIWTNKKPKAFFNAGWFNDVSDTAQTNTSYNFPYSAGGVTFALNGPSFTIYSSQNITGVITSMLNTNKCGIKNTSGVTKNFLIRGKCTGRSTASTWISLGLINGATPVEQIRPSRTHGWCINNESLTLNFECMVAMAHNDEVYLAGCIHSNVPAFFYLINIFLNVVEI